MKHFLLVVSSVMLIGSADNVLAQGASNRDGKQEFEFFAGPTTRLDGARAIVIVGRQTADSGENNVLPFIGFATSRFGRVFGSQLDFSFVDGGEATASIGSNTSTVRARLFDFHGAIQFQYPGKRARPYALVGSGFGYVSNTGTLTLARFTQNIDVSGWAVSYIYGGGVRINFTDRAGIRIGLEGVTFSPISSDSLVSTTNYGRFIVGAYFSGR